MRRLPDYIYELAEEILMESIKYPTVLGESYGDLVKYYAEILGDHGIHTTIYRVPEEYLKKNLPPEHHPERPRYILMARIGSGKRVLQFNGHYDVVFPGEGWTITEPFTPLKKDGRIYGRGSTDMKGGIAAFLAAMTYLADKDIDPGFVVEAAVVPDEEIGGVAGTGYLVNEMGSRPDWVVIAEPSGLDNIMHGHKGLVWLDVVVKGKQAHGSTPWLGDNAFEKMIYIAKHLVEEYKPLLRKRKSKYTYESPGGEYPVITMGGKLTAPGSINIVPGKVSFSIDRRLIIEENTEQVIEELKKYIKEAAKKYKANVEIKVLEKMEPAFVPPDAEIVSMLSKAIKKVLGVEAKKTICVGGLDLRYYAYKGIQVATYGPGNLEMAHRVNEYIEIKNLHRVIDVYVELINMISGKQGK